MDQFLSQPLNMSISPPSFIDSLKALAVISEIQRSQTLSLAAPLVVNYDQVIIDFTGSPVAGYSFSYQDPNDPAGVVYDVRWAVITVTSNRHGHLETVHSGSRRQGGNGIYKPVTLDTILEQ